MLLSHYIWDFVTWPENESRGDLYGWLFAEEVCWPLPGSPRFSFSPTFLSTFTSGFPGGSVVRNLPASAGDLGWTDTLEKEMAVHLMFLPGEFHGQRGLESYSPWGCKESDRT